MAIVKPFKGLRPRKDLAEKVTSLPYDVMNRQEASEIAKGNPYSFLHICRSEIDLPDEKNPYAKSVYEKARDNIQKFIDETILIKDENPCFYIYRQNMEGRVQTGVVACASIDDYQNNVIKKHELTRVEKELDRINHFDVCNAHTEPVFLTYHADKVLNSIIASWIEKHPAEYDFSTEDGIQHILWVVDQEETIDLITKAFAAIPALYIADGHHRSASAVKVGLKRREENPDYTGLEDFNFYMTVIFPDEDLHVFDYNRVVKDLNGLSAQEFLNAIEEDFDISPISKEAGETISDEVIRPKNKHEFSLFLEDKWYTLKAKPHLIDNKDPIKALDVSILQTYILDPLLGIKDPRTDNRIDFVGGIRGLKWLEHRCQTDMKLAFALYPVTIEDLMHISDEDKIMPPKSTWFEPKLGSGLFVHKL